jgi:F0F1-type ATP synthase membrane subunit b/b'
LGGLILFVVLVIIYYFVYPKSEGVEDRMSKSIQRIESKQKKQNIGPSV